MYQNLFKKIPEQGLSPKDMFILQYPQLLPAWIITAQWRNCCTLQSWEMNNNWTAHVYYKEINGWEVVYQFHQHLCNRAALTSPICSPPGTNHSNRPWMLWWEMIFMWWGSPFTLQVLDLWTRLFWGRQNHMFTCWLPNQIDYLSNVTQGKVKHGWTLFFSWGGFHVN